MRVATRMVASPGGDPPGERAAVKILAKNAPTYREKLVCREVFTHRLFALAGGNSHIADVFEVAEDEKNVYLFMELLQGGELFQRISTSGPYTEKHAANLVVSMLDALSFCHRLNVTHRDVKPENFVFRTPDSGTSVGEGSTSPGAAASIATGSSSSRSGGKGSGSAGGGPGNHVYSWGQSANLKLIDFGISHYTEDPSAMCRTLCGTPLYLAPEVYFRLPYGPEADMWALGVIVYIMLVGYPPFFDDDVRQLVRQVKFQPVNFDASHFSGVSAEAKDFLVSLLDKDPSSRMTSQQALEHDWLRNSCRAASEARLDVVQSSLQRLLSSASGSSSSHAAPGGRDIDRSTLPPVPLQVGPRRRAVELVSSTDRPRSSDAASGGRSGGHQQLPGREEQAEVGQRRQLRGQQRSDGSGGGKQAVPPSRPPVATGDRPPSRPSRPPQVSPRMSWPNPGGPITTNAAVHAEVPRIGIQADDSSSSDDDGGEEDTGRSSPTAGLPRAQSSLRRWRRPRGGRPRSPSRSPDASTAGVPGTGSDVGLVVGTSAGAGRQSKQPTSLGRRHPSGPNSIGSTGSGAGGGGNASGNGTGSSGGWGVTYAVGEPESNSRGSSGGGGGGAKALAGRRPVVFRAPDPASISEALSPVSMGQDRAILRKPSRRSSVGGGDFTPPSSRSSGFDYNFGNPSTDRPFGDEMTASESLGSHLPSDFSVASLSQQSGRFEEASALSAEHALDNIRRTGFIVGPQPGALRDDEDAIEMQEVTQRTQSDFVDGAYHRSDVWSSRRRRRRMLFGGREAGEVGDDSLSGNPGSLRSSSRRVSGFGFGSGSRGRERPEAARRSLQFAPGQGGPVRTAEGEAQSFGARLWRRKNVDKVRNSAGTS